MIFGYAQMLISIFAMLCYAMLHTCERIASSASFSMSIHSAHANPSCLPSHPKIKVLHRPYAVLVREYPTSLTSVDSRPCVPSLPGMQASAQHERSTSYLQL
jgi:hypothetical protein